MQSLARPGYTAEQVIAELHMEHGTRTVDFRYELLDNTNKFVRRLTNVRSGQISYDSTQDVPRTARLEMTEDDDAISFLSHRVKAYMMLLMPDGKWVEWPLGVFLLAYPSRSTSTGAGVALDVEAYDLALVYADDLVDDRYAVTAGTNYVTAVLALLGAGVRVDSVPTTKLLPVTQEWEIGSSKLQIINDLLGAIGYEPLHFDENGRAVIRPLVLPSARSPEYTYLDNSTSVIVAGVAQSIDYKVPNKFVRVVSEADRAVLRSEFVNSNPDSPTSTVTVGRTITSFETVDAADQASLDLITEQAAFTASQVTDEIRFNTAVMPHHSHSDVIMMKYAKLGVAYKYNETAWSMDLRPGGRMEHTLQRVISVG